MAFPGIHASYHAVRAVLELVYFVAGIGLLVVGFFALGQLRIAKTDIATRVRREAAKESANQLDLWATQVIAAMDELTVAERQVGFQSRKCSMERFDTEELLSKPADDRTHAANALRLFYTNATIKRLTLKASNLIEASAMCFMTGVADEQIAFMPLSSTFCGFVERTYYLYCGLRHQGQLDGWEYTVRLYRVWSQRRQKHELDAKQNALSKALMKAEDEATPIQPMGS